MELYRHNEEAYRAAAAMLEETGKAAVIHPTGSGKTGILASEEELLSMHNSGSRWKLIESLDTDSLFPSWAFAVT